MQIVWQSRKIAFYSLLVILTCFFALTGIITAVLPFNWRYWYITRWSHSTIWLAKFICGLDYRVRGLENLPPAPFVALSNHQSMWETIFMQVLLPPQSWVLKKELLFIPFFGWGLALLRPIAINRQDFFSAKNLLKQGIQKLQQGMCVLIFPEGTRVAPGNHSKFKKTGAELALQAQVPLVPIAHNAGRLWPRGPWIKCPGMIEVVIGKPLALNRTASELTHELQHFIKTQNL